LALAADAGPAAPSQPAGVLLDRIAAVVNDEVVLLSEVYDLGDAYIAEGIKEGTPRAVLEREVLDKLIERRLVEQEISRLKLDVGDEDVDRAVDDVARRNGLDREQLRAELLRQGVAWDTYRSELRESLRDMRFGQSVLRPRITITDDELKDLWIRRAGKVDVASHVQALVILLKAGDAAQNQEARQRAEGLLAQARGGASFAELSRAHDEGPYGAHDGEMGTFTAGELVEPLDVAVTAARVGEVAMVEMASGIFLLRVADRQAASGEFEAQRESLANEVFDSRLADEKERWFQQARRAAAIRILLPEAG
jgi:peptidyl-prolyl cis-trans isomerase SurA